MNPYALEMNDKTKVFLLHRNGNGKEVGEKSTTPCYVEGLYASDGILDLDLDINLISQEIIVKLNLKFDLENGDKKIDKKLSMKLVGETMDDSIEKTKSYELEFYVNPEEDDVEPDII